jgi:uncharacterized membrane protein
MRRSPFLLVATLGFLLCSPVTYAQLEVCNQANMPVYTAVGYPENGHWFSEGWWDIDPGQCKRVYGSPLTNRYYYVRAVAADQSHTWEASDGSNTFCVQAGSFKLQLSPVFSCSISETEGPQPRSFVKIDVGNSKFFSQRVECPGCSYSPPTASTSSQGSGTAGGSTGQKRGTASDAGQGQFCAGNQQCASGNCVNNFCQPVKAIGEFCYANQECASRNCVNHSCQTHRADGQFCDSNQECSSGNCIDRACRTVKGNGQACVANQECANRNCVNRVCQTLKWNGQVCVANQECGSGNCFNRACQATKPRGQGCAANQECSSKNCLNRVCQ